MGARSSSVKIWGWAVTQRTRLNGSTIHMQGRADPGCEVSCHGTEWTCIVGSSVIRWGQSNSGEGCIMLQSGLTRSLVAKFPFSRCLQYVNFMLQGKNAVNEATDGCVWTFDVRCRVAQRTYVPSDSLRENLAWWAVTRRTTKLSKLGGGHFHVYVHLLGTIRYLIIYNCSSILNRIRHM